MSNRTGNYSILPAMKRRDFFKLSAAMLSLTGVSSLTGRALGRDNTPSARSTRVTADAVIIKRPDIITSRNTIPPITLAEMLSSAVCSLTGIMSPRMAWRSIFSPSEKIGIKVNALGGKMICTCPELAYAVAHQLISSGVSPGNIIIWDRLSSELERSGYSVDRSTSRIQCYGTDTAYEYSPLISGSIGSCFSKILTHHCDAIISIPVLKDHNLSGVSLNLKSFYGAIHNPNKYHDNGCNPFIADLNACPYIKNKFRLSIIDGLTAQCNGGPGYVPAWSWPFGGIIMTRDPVAGDALGKEIIEKQRVAVKLPSLEQENRSAYHIQDAAQKKLGIADLRNITVKQL